MGGFPGVREWCSKVGWRTASFSVALAWLSAPLFAQVNTGRISGQVTDQTGGAVGGAKVTVIDVARGQNRDLAADAAGEYAEPSLGGPREMQLALRFDF